MDHEVDFETLDIMGNGSDLEVAEKVLNDLIEGSYDDDNRILKFFELYSALASISERFPKGESRNLQLNKLFSRAVQEIRDMLVKSTSKSYIKGYIRGEYQSERRSQIEKILTFISVHDKTHTIRRFVDQRLNAES